MYTIFPLCKFIRKFNSEKIESYLCYLYIFKLLDKVLNVQNLR